MRNCDTRDKGSFELEQSDYWVTNCQRASITSKKEGFAVIVKSRHLGNSIGGIYQVKFIDDINLVVLIWSESQSWGRKKSRLDGEAVVQSLHTDFEKCIWLISQSHGHYFLRLKIVLYYIYDIAP